jgi:uncharacterized membrane protein YbaN (DUF454 family)
MKRIVLMSAGFCSLGLGVAGIFLPVLPTTPFLLLSASCFLRSSDRLYRWLIAHRVFGRYIENYLKHRAVTLRAKVSSIALLWLTIGSTIVFFVDFPVVRAVLALIAAGVTVHLLRLRTFTPDRTVSREETDF